MKNYKEFFEKYKTLCEEHNLFITTTMFNEAMIAPIGDVYTKEDFKKHFESLEEDVDEEM